MTTSERPYRPSLAGMANTEETTRSTGGSLVTNFTCSCLSTSLSPSLVPMPPPESQTCPHIEAGDGFAGRLGFGLGFKDLGFSTYTRNRKPLMHPKTDIIFLESTNFFDEVLIMYTDGPSLCLMRSLSTILVHFMRRNVFIV